ncbi:MAG: 30S ribosomal protein S21 [Patescibacteria group bacterium]
MIEVKKKDHESVESLIRRFNKRVQQSGVLLRAKKRRFFEPPRSKEERRQAALRGKLIQERKEYLRKTGQLTEEELKSRSRNTRVRNLLKRGLPK